MRLQFCFYWLLSLWTTYFCTCNQNGKQLATVKYFIRTEAWSSPERLGLPVKQFIIYISMALMTYGFRSQRDAKSWLEPLSLCWMLVLWLSKLNGPRVTLDYYAKLK